MYLFVTPVSIIFSSQIRPGARILPDTGQKTSGPGKYGPRDYSGSHFFLYIWSLFSLAGGCPPAAVHLWTDETNK